MKFQLIILFFIVGFLSSCITDAKGDDAAFIVADENALIELIDDYTLKLPNYFIEMSDLNPNAILQYGFIEKLNDSETGDEDEFFVTVDVLDKSDLKPSISDSGLVSINKVNLRTAINLNLILDDFKTVIEQPKIELINGVSTMRNEFSGRLGMYNVFYKMAIFETEKYFFQLLTWCMKKHADKHKNEMDSMILSFENKK